MRIEYFRAMWGMEQPSLEANLTMIKEGGFDGVEMGVPADNAERRELRSLLDELSLDLIAQQWTIGASPEEHARSFEEQYRRGEECSPLFINSHTGKDYYSTEENLTVFRKVQELEEKTGLQVMHEIHRGRATFSVMATMALIEAMPDIKLTADFSHWCCVHESLLKDQAASVERAIKRSFHLHARVGYAEGPQVTDPRAPEWREEVETHIGWWKKIAAHQQKEGRKVLTICPEFGPPGYQVTLPYTRQPLVNLWEVNCYMKDLLKERLG
ncbi:MAG: sugar phosphate isomerase/epimerase [Spirochaetales bacterium]|nr:MAG: sugar phosphate isomerase/epimerase [Spirochaetales bacterium]